MDPSVIQYFNISDRTVYIVLFLPSILYYPTSYISINIYLNKVKRNKNVKT